MDTIHIIISFIKSLFNLKPLTAGDFILLVTAVIVFIYTKATKKGNELQLSPLISLRFEPSMDSNTLNQDGKLFAKNIGKGPAYNINFKPFRVKEGDDGFYTYTFYISNRVLEAGEEVELKQWISTPSGGVEASGMTRFLFRAIPQSLNYQSHIDSFTQTPAIFIINYTGINGKKYHSVYRLYSMLPPVGEVVVQLLHQGRGKIGKIRSRLYHLFKKRMHHHGLNKEVQDSCLIEFLSYIHKKFLSVISKK